MARGCRWTRSCPSGKRWIIETWTWCVSNQWKSVLHLWYALMLNNFIHRPHHHCTIPAKWQSRSLCLAAQLIGCLCLLTSRSWNRSSPMLYFTIFSTVGNTWILYGRWTLQLSAMMTLSVFLRSIPTWFSGRKIRKQTKYVPNNKGQIVLVWPVWRCSTELLRHAKTLRRKLWPQKREPKCPVCLKYYGKFICFLHFNFCAWCMLRS